MACSKVGSVSPTIPEMLLKFVPHGLEIETRKNLLAAWNELLDVIFHDKFVLMHQVLGGASYRIITEELKVLCLGHLA